MGKEEIKRKMWRQCSNCSKWSETKREGVCGYLTEYNQLVVYTYRNFRCGKHKFPGEED